MIKILALNEESSEDSGGSEENEVSREALEQIAIAQYSKALELQRNGPNGVRDALALLKDLLNTELLDDVKVPDKGEKVTDPLINLKYLCYKNVASIQASLGNNEEAIQAYCDASYLDDTDVSLWYRLGTICLQSNKFEMALDAFQRGTNCNPKHWPCIDNIITLLLGLSCYNECISAIHQALKLDPGYLRGLAYRKYIYTEYPYILEYMSYVNTEYKWTDQDVIDEVKAEILIAEAKNINEKYVTQVKETTFVYTLPQLKLKKPITKLSWVNLGESLIHMHTYMTELCYTHASKLELTYEREEVNEKNNFDLEKTTNSDENKSTEKMEIDIVEDNLEKEKTEAEKSSPDKPQENEKAGSETENTTLDKVESKDQKKTAVRRRGSSLSFLEQWEWCTKRRSSRKKPQTKQERADENIYETLRRLIPMSLTNLTQKNSEKSEIVDDSPDTMDLYRLFEEKQTTESKENQDNNESYFATPLECNDVNDFIAKFKDGQSDIIEILKHFLMTLSLKWKCKWPIELINIFIEANKCFSQHFAVPNYLGGEIDDIKIFTFVNMLSEEILINQKLDSNDVKKEIYCSSYLEALGIFVKNPQIFQEDCMETTLRYLWLKCHYHILNKNDECALDCLYQLLREFNAMGEQEDLFTLKNINFTFKPIISKSETLSLIESLERNKRLTTVLGLYESGNLEEALNIILDSFEHCKTIARKQEYKEISLDFAVQISLILDCYWELGKSEECFKWSMICLHESLKQYLLFSSGTRDFEKWSLVVVKVLLCIEHCLKTEGIIMLDLLSEKDLSQVIEDIIQIIVKQVDDNDATDMPLNTVTPWIILHYILQKEDQGKLKKVTESDKSLNSGDDIASSLMILFVGHEYLGQKSWCMNNDGKLLLFILDTIIPRLRAPLLTKCLEDIRQHLEQCVFCIFGHPSKKTKLRYLIDHNVTPKTLDWEKAQQMYEIFRPVELPKIEGKLPSITADTEQLFQKIITLLPADLEPKSKAVQVLKYIESKTDELPAAPNLLPFKMRDLYFLLGDYYFKKDERSKSMKYNLYDVLINNDRFESWAEIALAKATNLEVKLNSSANIKDMDYINDASSAIKCFKQALNLDSMHCNLWIEYGVFVYGLHSFCSRLVKQASESMSMEDFASLEQRKDKMLDIAQKCFTIVSQDLNSSDAQEDENDEFWLHYYMLGKVAEKKNKLPQEYMDHYLKAAKHLEDNSATYPLKINYNSPQHLSIEALEIQYRIHATALKFIELHENRDISLADGKFFLDCLEKCANGPFSTKTRSKKDGIDESDKDCTKTEEKSSNALTLEGQHSKTEQSPQASIIYKRSISDSGEDVGVEAKKQKIETAAKVRRAVSYDAECQAIKNSLEPKDSALDVLFKAAMVHSQEVNTEEKIKDDSKPNIANNKNSMSEDSSSKMQIDTSKKEKTPVPDSKNEPQKEDTTSNSDSSSSSSDSSSDDSSSDSSSSSDTNSTVKSNVDSNPLNESDRKKIISMCLDGLEDCVSRFPQHYKALYRLAHYHFYSKKDKDIERCRDLMLGYFMSRSNNKLPGLFCERKNNNFFNAIWRIPTNEVDRAGSFGFHMSRCVLLSMEILKEIDDHKTLLDLNIQLSKIPEPDKKYLRDSEREELSQQALSLCVQSLKGQLTKFSQQSDLKTNETERSALNSLMLDIYRAYQKVQKQPCSKQFTSLLVEGFKLINLAQLNEQANLVDLSMRHCQALIASLKQQATMASMNNANAKKNLSKSFEAAKTQSQVNQGQPIVKSTTATTSVQPDPKVTQATATLPTLDITTSYKNYLPMLNNALLQQQSASAMSLLNMTPSLISKSLPNTLPQVSSFQTEYYNQILSTLAANYALTEKNLQDSRNKNYNKPPSATGKIHKPKTSTKNVSGMSNITKADDKSKKIPKIPTLNMITNVTSVITNYSSTSNKNNTASSSSTSVTMSKSFSAPTPYAHKVLPPVSAPTSSMSAYRPTTPPAHQTTIPTPLPLTSGNAKPAHMNATSTVSAAIHTKPPLPHQQVSPGKTLQEKLAERQKSSLPVSNINIKEISSFNSSNPSMSSSNIANTKTTDTYFQDSQVTDGKISEKNLASKSFVSEVIVLDDDS